MPGACRLASGRSGAAFKSNVEHDLAKVPAALLVTECGDNLFQREVTVDHRAQPVCLDRPHHLLLLAAAAHQQRLQAQLAESARPSGSRLSKPPTSTT